MHCTTFNAPHEVAHLEPSWTELWRQAEERFITTSPQWFRLWTAQFGHAGIRTFKIHDDNRVHALATLKLDGNTGAFPYTTDLADYNDFLYAPQADLRAALATLLRHVARETPVAHLQLQSVPDSSPTASALRAAAAESGWSYAVADEDASPYKTLPADWETYMRELNSKHRHELERKLRRLQDAGQIEHTVLRQPREVQAAAPQLLDFIKASTPEKLKYMIPAREQFFIRAIDNLSAQRQILISNLALNGTVLAASLAFLTNGTVYIYNAGYNTSHYRLSPGLLNHLFLIKWAIEQGLQKVDFMRGDERYKYELGSTDRRLLSIDLHRTAGL